MSRSTTAQPLSERNEAGKAAVHVMAFLTAAVWGMTFVASSLLLEVLTARQLVLVRFAVSYVVLWLLSIGKQSPPVTLKNELRFAALGLFGVTGYQLLENIALEHTSASNVGIIIAAAPIFTAIAAHLFTRDEKITARLIVGSLTAFIGVALVTFNGAVLLKLSPLGDIMALLAAISWAVYSMILKGVVGQWHAVTVARRTMFYGLLLAVPVVLIEGKPIDLAALLDTKLLLSLALLGLLGGGLCYITWNIATRRLGTVVTNNYIYVSPFITMITAAIVLGEPITVMGFAGTVLIILGVAAASGKKGTQSRTRQ